mmetsp:Transcript_28620/g.85146  ORF Transcript_28620/g.85146 Transcript_28620/m.85146 type:complete len:225 (-) Transcript_28620:84-758(-)
MSPMGSPSTRGGSASSSSGSGLGAASSASGSAALAASASASIRARSCRSPEGGPSRGACCCAYSCTSPSGRYASSATRQECRIRYATMCSSRSSSGDSMKTSSTPPRHGLHVPIAEARGAPLAPWLPRPCPAQTPWLSRGRSQMVARKSPPGSRTSAETRSASPSNSTCSQAEGPTRAGRSRTAPRRTASTTRRGAGAAAMAAAKKPPAGAPGWPRTLRTSRTE